MPDQNTTDELRRLVDLPSGDLVKEFAETKTKFKDFLQKSGISVPKISLQESNANSPTPDMTRSILLDEFTKETLSSIDDSVLTVYSTAKPLIDLYDKVSSTNLLDEITVTLEGEEPCTAADLKSRIDSGDATGDKQIVLSSNEIKTLIPEFDKFLEVDEDNAVELTEDELNNVLEEVSDIDAPPIEDDNLENLVQNEEPADSQKNEPEEKAEAVGKVKEEPVNDKKTDKPEAAKEQIVTDAKPEKPEKPEATPAKTDTVTESSVEEKSTESKADGKPKELDPYITQEEYDKLFGADNETESEPAKKPEVDPETEIKENTAEKTETTAEPNVAQEIAEEAETAPEPEKIDKTLIESETISETLTQDELDALFSTSDDRDSVSEANVNENVDEKTEGDAGESKQTDLPTTEELSQKDLDALFESSENNTKADSGNTNDEELTQDDIDALLG